MNCTEITTLDLYLKGVAAGKLLLAADLMLIISIILLVYSLIVLAEYLNKKND